MEKIFLIIYFSLLLNIIISSHIFPIKKIKFTNNIKNLCDRRIIEYNFEGKGFGILFNEESNIGFIPYNLFNDISNYFSSNEHIILTLKKYENGTQEIVIDAILQVRIMKHFILF